MSELVVERTYISKVVVGEFGAPKGERADFLSLGGSPCWLVLDALVPFKPLIGKTKSVRFMKVSPDAPSAFAKVIVD